MIRSTINTLGFTRRLLSSTHKPPRPKKKRSTRLAIEQLEDRTAPALLTIQYVADQLRGHVSDVTVITHGFQPSENDGDSLLDLANAIHNRAGGWLVNYSVTGEG